MVDMMSGFILAGLARESGAKAMVFDWHKAADILREREATEASAGLDGDLEYTEGTILREGVPVTEDNWDNCWAYLASIWATPVLIIGGEKIPCWEFEDELPEPWDARTCWPESALVRFSAPSAAPED